MHNIKVGQFYRYIYELPEWYVIEISSVGALGDYVLGNVIEYTNGFSRYNSAHLHIVNQRFTVGSHPDAWVKDSARPYDTLCKALDVKP